MAVANPLIEVLLTAKWLPSALYFKLLCVVGLFYIFQAINGEILKTKGKSGWVLRVEIVTKTIMVINIIITWQWGITAIILGHIIAVFTAYLMSSIYVSKLIGYSIWQQWKDISAYLALAGIMFLLVVFVPKVVPAPLLSLTIMTVVGLFFYIFMATIFKLDEISEIKKLIGR
jgi:O-antigen/teichoic acid export membrane protein